MAKTNFTKRVIETVAVPANGSVFFQDSGVAGLGLRVWANGKKFYFWSRRVNRTLQYVALGDCTSTTLDEARAAATKRNAQVDEWRRNGFVGSAPWAAPPALTLNQLIEEYKSRYVDSNLRKPKRTRQIIKSQMETHCGELRNRNLSQITKSEVIALREQVHKVSGKYASNRLIETLRAAVNWGIEVDLWAGGNPFADIAKFKENSRERFLQPDEFARLKAALDSPATSDDLRDFTRLALFTGARKSDILSMNWKDIDVKRRVWLVPVPKVTPYYIALAPEAVTILEERLKRAASDEQPSSWVFPNPDSSTGHLMDLKKAWAKMLGVAKIENLWIHDLRRTLGSVQAEAGTSLVIIGKSLGHQNPSSTSVYARLQLESVRKSVEGAVSLMSKSMEAKPVAQLPAPAKRKAAQE
jgi:integrase